MNKRLLLVDGNSLINRAFYGLGGAGSSLTLPDGTPSGAVLTFFNMILRQITDVDPSHLAVAFDTPHKTFRHEMDTDYKGNRKGMPDDLAVQMPVLKSALDGLGFFRIEEQGYEADDLIGTITKHFANEGHEVFILSGDRDDFQLLDEKVRVIYPKGRGEIKIYDPETFKEEFGFDAEFLVDYKAIRGDSSDNIKGVKGIGEKGATELVRQYGTLDAIYENLEQIKPALQKKLSAGAEDAKLSYRLAALDCAVPVELDIEKMEYPGLFRAETLLKLRELDFGSIIDRFNIEQGVRELTPLGGGEEAESGTESEEAKALHELPGLKRIPLTEDGYSEWLDDIKHDVERQHQAGQEVLMAAAPAEAGTNSDEGPAFSLIGVENGVIFRLAAVPADRVTAGPFPEGHYPSFSEPEEFRLMPDVIVYQASAELGARAVRDLMEAGVWLTGHALGKLYHRLRYFPLDGTFDTRIAAYLLNQAEGESSLALLAQSFDPMLTQYGDRRDDLSEAEQALLWLPSVVLHQAAALEQAGLEFLAYEVEFPLAAILAGMEVRGVRVDENMLNVLEAEFNERAELLAKEIYEHAGREFNINSPKQLSEILFEELDLPGGKKTASGNYSTAAEEMERLKAFHPIVSLILEYRQITKLNNTFVTGLSKEISPEDGRVHTSYHQTLTTTGRLSSSNPNLQNIPIRVEEGRQIRKAFLPEEGREFLDADYSQIELRLLAHLSGDETMIEAFRNERDIHRTTAARLFGVGEEAVSTDMRAAAKTVNFSIVYGISDYGLSRDLGIPVKEAHEYIEGYYAQYPGVRTFMEDAISKAKEDGYVETMFGRRRLIPELSSKNYNMRQFGERVAMNTPIQGTAADIMKIAMVRTERALRASGIEAEIILQVHDELLLETSLEDAEEAARILEEAMVQAADLDVELVAEVHAGLSWYDTK